MNKKIKIIELLNKTANGEEIKEFIYKGYIYQRHDGGYYRSVIDSNWVGFHTDFDICSKEILNDSALLEDNTEEIEELKEKNENLLDALNNSIDIKKYWVNKDKIKAKIEELNKVFDMGEEWYNKDYIVEVLQSLLEKE